MARTAARKDSRKPFTAAEIEDVKCPEGKKRIALIEPGGLALRVTDKGAKSWCLIKHQGGKQVWTTLGTYPALSLSKAREAARGIGAKMDHGYHPAAEKRRAAEQAKAAAEAAARNTLKARYEGWAKLGYPAVRQRKATKRPRTVAEIKRYFETDLLPTLGSTDMRTITRLQISERLDVIGERGLVAANRAKSHYGTFWRWAVDRGYADANPVPTSKWTVEEPRDRVLDASELRLIWRAAEVLGPVYAATVRTRLLLPQRRNEVCGALWSEVGDDAIWRIPAERSKSTRPQEVPLPPAVLALWQTMPRIEISEGKLSDLVFPGRGGTKVLSNHDRRKKKLDKQIAKLNGGKAIPDWHLHDGRHTILTWMEENGISDAIRGEIADHSKATRMGITATYSHGKLTEEKKKALTAWADHLLAVVTAPAPETADNVIVLKAQGRVA